jgi:flagellar hook capping protein FlgD
MSRVSWFVILALASMLSSPALARPLDQSRAMPKIQVLDPSGPASDVPFGARGVMHAATAGTTFYGGTFWAADSMRWEAYQNRLWTFDSGVGSSMVSAGGVKDLSSPTSAWVNPYKRPGLHATMEGWIGFDNTYSEVTYFRRIASTDPRFGAIKCTGAAAGLGGTYSYWCGVFPDEATALCYAGGQGYGNAWNVCIEHSFSYPGGNVTLGFQYKNDTEDTFDYTHVYCDTSGDGHDVELVSYTGTPSGTASILLTQGVQLPMSPKSIKIKFCVATDGAYSDQDGGNPTVCGAFAVDNITLTGAITHTATFETSDDGWTLAPPQPGRGGEWANLYHVNDLPPTLTVCPCALYDSVLAFPDENNGHNNYQDNLAASPWIDLKAYGSVGTTGKIIKANMYADLPLRNYIFFQFNIQWYPEKCEQTGKLVTSPWTADGFINDFYTTYCTSRTPGTLGTQIDFSSFCPPGAEQVRIAVGVLSYCRFFANCTQTSNTTPWYDEVGLGVYGNSNIPFVFADEINRAQDDFPANGTLNLYATGRVDCNRIQGASQPEIGTTMGDTLVVYGAVGNAEVYVHFRVTPGPGTHPSRFQAWYGRHAVSTVDPNFRMARMDTAEWGKSGPISGNWMTAYHESDPNFWGTDRTIDAHDVAPNGGMWRLDNDIFPDDLFTAGTRLDYFFTANKVGQTEYTRDPASGYYEMEILPSSMTAQSKWNCVLYVDHFNRGTQGYIENALTTILGTGSENAEGTNWDRYDVNAASSQQGSFGRPLQSDYGATVIQALGYKTILWDSGNLNAFNLTKEDADVLNPWLAFDHNLYLSGDGIVFSPISEGDSEPSARHLVQDLAGVTIAANCATGTYRNQNCPTTGAPLDMTPCVDLDPVSGSLVADHPSRTIGQVGQGNGCPQLRSFDVLSLLTPEHGTVTGDENYASPVKSASFASAATNAGADYKIVADGLSVGFRRDAGTPCDVLLGGTTAVTARLYEVLNYFGYASTSNAPCVDTMVGVGLPPEATPPSRLPTTLNDISPNPLASGRDGRIRFTMERGGQARVEVFNLEGRLVRSLFDGTAEAGENEVSWNGTDGSGRRVATGVYILRLHTAGEDLSRRVVVLRNP